MDKEPRCRTAMARYRSTGAEKRSGKTRAGRIRQEDQKLDDRQ